MRRHLKKEMVCPLVAVFNQMGWFELKLENKYLCSELQRCGKAELKAAKL